MAGFLLQKNVYYNYHTWDHIERKHNCVNVKITNLEAIVDYSELQRDGNKLRKYIPNPSLWWALWSVLGASFGLLRSDETARLPVSFVLRWTSSCCSRSVRVFFCNVVSHTLSCSAPLKITVCIGLTCTTLTELRCRVYEIGCCCAQWRQLKTEGQVTEFCVLWKHGTFSDFGNERERESVCVRASYIPQNKELIVI